MAKSIVTIEEETIKTEKGKLFIKRTITLNHEKVYDYMCSVQAYSKEISPLKYFSYWLNDHISSKDFSQIEKGNNIIHNRTNIISFFNKIWFKFFRKKF